MSIIDDCFSDKGCFHELFPEGKEYFQSKKQQLSYSKGENICKQGAFAPHVMYVYDGLVKIYMETGNGKQLNIRIAKPGDFISFQSVLGQSVYQYSAQAITEANICLMDKEGLQKLLKDEVEASWHIIAKNYKNESDLYSILFNATSRQMPGKLAHALLYLSSEEFIQYQVFSLLTRKEIAEFAGISLESAVKLLKEFESDGVLELNGKDIKVVNREALKRIEQNG